MFDDKTTLWPTCMPCAADKAKLAGGCSIAFEQSTHEGALITESDPLPPGKHSVDYIELLVAYTHTSIALMDCDRFGEPSVVEVHFLSNIQAAARGVRHAVFTRVQWHWAINLRLWCHRYLMAL